MEEYILNLIRSPEGSRDSYKTSGSETFLSAVKFLRQKYHITEDNPTRLETVNDKGTRLPIDPAKKISEIFPEKGEYNVWWYTQKSFGREMGSSLRQFAEDVICLVEIYRNGWNYLDDKKPGLGAYRYCVCYRTECACKITDYVHAAAILPSFFYPTYPPQVIVIPKVNHACCNSISKKMPRKIRKTRFKNWNYNIGCVHWEAYGYWKPHNINRLETVAIALKEEFKLF